MTDDGLTTAPSGKPLAEGLRVIEIGESISAALAGMVMADQGADVLMVERPGGSRLRQLPAFRMWARGKRSTVIDLTTAGGREELARLAEDADVVITALEPATADRLGASGVALTARNPRLVHCEITGFGRGHELSDIPGHEGIVTARAGRAYELSVLFQGERPAFPFVPVASYGAAMLSLQGVFAALLERERTGEGQRIETSLLRALSVFDLSGWVAGADRALRIADVPVLFYFVGRTSDGVWVQFSQNAPRLFAAMLRALDLEHLTEQERFRAAPHLPPDDARGMRALLLQRLAERSWDEWRPIFERDPNVSAEPFLWPGDALTHPQLVHTGDARAFTDPEVGDTRQLGPLATFSATPAVGMRPAPTVGTDDGFSPRPRARKSTTTSARASAPPLLQGVTVLEMATWIATPMGTSLLAELGARVIKIEPLEGDPMRRHGPVSFKCIQGKESIALDLKTDEGRAIVHALAARADVFAHNYRPGVPERLGIDATTLRAINPKLIHVYAASYGSTGPKSPLPAFHVTAGAVCGGALAQCGSRGAPGPDVELSLDELAAWSQRLTRANEPNPDFNASLGFATAVTMALYAASRHGEGQAVETRMMASNAYTLSEHFIEYSGRAPRKFPDPELNGLHALYRLYPARRGWVFVAVTDDDFAALCDAIERPDLARDARFANASTSEAADEALAAELSAVFAADDAAAWQQRLTARHLACVEAQDGPTASYITESPWSERLRFVEAAASPGAAPYVRYGRCVQTSRDLGRLGGFDELGARTRAILSELGYADAEIESLLAAGVVGAPQRVDA